MKQLTRLVLDALTLPAKLADEETVFSEDTSLIFKETKITRFIDCKRSELVYQAINRKPQTENAVLSGVSCQ